MPSSVSSQVWTLLSTVPASVHALAPTPVFAPVLTLESAPASTKEDLTLSPLSRWFARVPMTICKVGHVLLPLPGETNVELTHFIIANDCFKYLGSVGEHISHIVAKSVEVSFGSHLITNKNLENYIYEKVSLPREFLSNASGSQASTIPTLGAVSFAMRLLQRFEFMINHGKWLEIVKPSIVPGISERIMEALASTDDNVDSCMKLKSELKDALTSLLEDYGVLAIPMVPGPPPKLNQDSTTLEDFRTKAFSLLAVAGLSGFC
ncbi:Amidase 1 [Platanthera guangdongensis]|uniref:Amidase 1 n=1 Tax=Platanthera guangdongensis TaxID=2320717 RepID=A0ABR2LTJ9_9ASPA